MERRTCFVLSKASLRPPNTALMLTQTYTHENYLFICCDGRLDSSTAANSEFDFCRHIFQNRSCSKVVLDLEKISYVSSAGLRVLLGLVKRLKTEGRELYIQYANQLVREIIEIAGFHLFINLLEYPILAETLKE